MTTASHENVYRSYTNLPERFGCLSVACQDSAPSSIQIASYRFVGFDRSSLRCLISPVRMNGVSVFTRTRQHYHLLLSVMLCSESQGEKLAPGNAQIIASTVIAGSINKPRYLEEIRQVSPSDDYFSKCNSPSAMFAVDAVTSDLHNRIILYLK